MDAPFSHRQATPVPTPAVTLYRFVLGAFPRLGRAPTPEEARQATGLNATEAADALRILQSYDAVRLDPASSWIGAAYPYSASPTRHIVWFPNGRSVSCMCAIDCFYVPFLTDHTVTIRSCCHACRNAIEIRIEDERIGDADPATAVVWDSDEDDDCPRNNFFCCQEHFRGWRSSNRSERGTALNLTQALERGRVAAKRVLAVIETDP